MIYPDKRRNDNPSLKVCRSLLLLVEGYDEASFFEEIGKTINIIDIDKIQISPVGGKSKFKQAIQGLLKIKKFKEKVIAIGIVQDADYDRESAESNIKKAFNENGLFEPTKPLTFNKDLTISTGYFIMPPNNEKGAIETACLFSIKDDPAMKHVNEYIENLRKDNECVNHRLLQIEKSMMSVFLASRKNPTWGIGNAVENNIFPLENPIFDQLKDLLINLYNILDNED